ncbi:MAG: DegT/DnrJ/EryC1/StrS family aminotransferase [Planctomycetes bacterium]|nr:DegT/DnrJ/EryC1/StrS family aminotransferase [Planctomycetota bacterium]
MIKHSCPTIGQTEARSLNAVLKTRHLAQGPMVHGFEDALVRYLKNKNLKAVAVNSGSSALHLALLSLGISAKDEVIIPSYICSAVLNTINYTGAKPVLADINENNFDLSIDSVKRKITRRTKAIIVAHQFGFPAEIDKFLSLGVPIIEDCAQSIGAACHNKQMGTFGQLSVFSFYATKMLCTGYGGMVVSGNKKLINKVRDLIDYDNRNDYIPRYNYQMSDLSASLGLAQLGQLNRFISRRRKIASRYTRDLSLLHLSSLILPAGQSDTAPVFFRYVIRHPRADKIIMALHYAGIEAKKPVYRPLHQYFGFSPKDFPNAEQAHRSAISLPIYPSLTDHQVNYIIDNLVKILKRL